LPVTLYDDVSEDVDRPLPGALIERLPASRDGTDAREVELFLGIGDLCHHAKYRVRKDVHRHTVLLYEVELHFRVELAVITHYRAPIIQSRHYQSEQRTEPRPLDGDAEHVVVVKFEITEPSNEQREVSDEEFVGMNDPLRVSRRS
jgi:hypothetical protein